MDFSRVFSTKFFKVAAFSIGVLFISPSLASAFSEDSLSVKEDSVHVTAVEEHPVAAAHEEEKFNAGEMILEHISDEHEWHILDLPAEHGEKHPVSVPLPIILWNNGHLDCFMSSGFHHGHDTVTAASGNRYYMDEKHHIQAIGGASFLDISITKNVLSLLVSAVLLFWVFISIARSYAKNKNAAPKGIQSALEPIILFVRDELAKPAIGKNYQRYMPYLLTVFFFIWFNNMLGLIPIIPFGANLTGNIAVTMTLALFTFIITTFIAKKDYWMHIFNTPGVPWWLKFPVPLMPVVEFLGVFIKPFVLTLRLFANMTAGHIIPLAFISLIFIFGQMSVGAGYGVSIMSVFLSLFMKVLELLVCFLQAYVFTLLSAMYFGMALEEHHHDHEHAEDHH